MKKILVISLFLLTLLGTTYNTIQSNIINNNMYNIGILDVVKLNSANAEPGGEIDYKIKDSCACKKNGQWTGSMSITECEAYTWYPPMTKQNCITTKCPSGQSC